jgi:quinol monooxygenase YgiN
LCISIQEETPCLSSRISLSSAPGLARPRRSERLLAALVAPTRGEAGCLNYDLYQSIENAEIWFVYESWCSMQDLDSHMKSVHLRAFLTAAPTLVEGDIDLRRFTMISTPATR